MIDEFFKKYDGAFSENTQRAYRVDYEHYETWCRKHSLDPLHVTDQNICEYIYELSQCLKPSCIRRRIHCVSSVFTYLDLPNPTKGKNVRLAFKKLYREKGRFQKQATPLTLDILRALQGVCDTSMAGERDKLLLQMGYETMRRRSELVSFGFEDRISITKKQHGLLLKRSKTDQYADGKIIPISSELNRMITEWGTRINVSHGPILRSVNVYGGVGECLSGGSIPRILQKLQDRADLNDLPTLSGHSFRVGAAIDLLEQGVPLYHIMLRGGWSSESSTMRYLRNWQAQALPFFDN